MFDTLTKKIEKALSEDELTGQAAIEVANNQGMVTLSGKVASQKIAEKAEKITKEQKGVLTVINQLKVDQSNEELDSIARTTASSSTT